MLADITAGSLNITKTDKQELLKPGRQRAPAPGPALVNREIEILELGKKIQSQVKIELTRPRKEYYLREHIKVLQKELGEGEEKGRK